MIIALPICVQPIFIKKAIEAGKHVLSEKPVGKDIETAAGLINWYKHQKREVIWSVGENFRFFEPITFAAEQIEKLGGELVTFSVDLYGYIDENDEFFRTAWYVSLCFLEMICPCAVLNVGSSPGDKSPPIRVVSFSMAVSITSPLFDASWQRQVK